MKWPRSETDIYMGDDIMRPIRITVLQTSFNETLAEQYGKGLSVCELHKPGQVFLSNGWQKPDGLCDSAWKCMESFVFALSHGDCDFFAGTWLKDRNTAIVSCNDGLRPVIFKIEPIDE